MAETLSLDFSVPPVDVRTTGPTGAPVPFQGLTVASRHSSWTGAEHAEETRSANIAAIRAHWKEPHTIIEIAELTHLPISSVCSLKSAIEDELEFVDYEPIDWGEGRKATKRSRWRIRRCREV